MNIFVTTAIFRHFVSFSWKTKSVGAYTHLQSFVVSVCRYARYLLTLLCCALADTQVIASAQEQRYVTRSVRLSVCPLTPLHNSRRCEGIR